MSILINNSKVFNTASKLYISFARGRVTDIFSHQMPLQQHNTAAGNILPKSYGLSRAPSEDGYPNFFWQSVTPVIAGSSASHTWKNNRSVTPHHLNQSAIFIVYT